MKTIITVVSLAIALSSYTAIAQGPTASMDLKSAFLRWKASEVDQQAYDNGFVPQASSDAKKTSLTSVDEPTSDELVRFQTTLDTVTCLQQEQSRATFSVDTPFTLMIDAEFKAFVGKSSGPNIIKELQKRMLTQTEAVASNSIATSTRSLGVASTTTNSTNAALDLKTETPWSVNVDWQTKGCVTRVKDQDGCGVC